MNDEFLFETQRLWPDPRKGPWYVALYWMEQDGALVPYGLTLLSGRRPGGEPHGSLLNQQEMEEVDRNPETGEVTRYPTGRFKEVVKRRRLTGEELRELRFGELVRKVAGDQQAFHEGWAWREEQRREALNKRAKQFEGAKRKPGRPLKWSREELAEIARAYDANRIQGVLGWYFTKTGGVVNETTASRWAKRAEDEGLLVRDKRRGK